jgi:hypothetical protein
METGDCVELCGKGLLARLVPECSPPGIGTRSPADKRKHQQRRFRNPPAARLRFHLVDAKGRESNEVDTDQDGRDIGGGEQLEHGVFWGGYGMWRYSAWAFNKG